MLLADMVRAVAFIVTTIVVCSVAAAEQPPTSTVPQFADGDRVCFVGDSITRGGHYHSQIQLFYATRYPERTIVGFNCGQSGSTALDTLGRLSWDILDQKPTVATVMFGMNDMGVEGSKATSPAEADKYIAEKMKKVEVPYGELLDGLQKANVKVILISPSNYDGTIKNAKYAAISYQSVALKRWTARLREIAEARGLTFVDVYTPLEAINTRLQNGDPQASIIGADRIHPGPAGHLVMAYAFLKAQGVEPYVSRINVDAATGKAGELFRATVDAIERSDRGIAFTAHEKSLPFVLTPGAELGMNVLQFNDELNRQILTVTNLVAGTYELRIDDTLIGSFTGEELKAGVNLAGNPKMPQYQQSLKLARLNDARNQSESTNFRTKSWARRALLQPANVDPSDPVAVEARIKEVIRTSKPGTFPQTMSEHYLKNILPKWDTIEKEYAQMQAQMPALRVTKPHHFRLTRVADAATRRSAYEQRDSDAAIAQVATDLFVQVDLDRPALSEVKRLFLANQHREALRAYRDLAFKTMSAFNFGATGFGVSKEKPVDTATMKAAALLLSGHYAREGGEPLPLPDMGDLDWSGAPGTVEFWASASRQIGFATPLLSAYRQTGDVANIKQWVRLTDSWAMSDGSYARLQHDAQTDNEAQQAIEFFITSLSQLSAAVSKSGDPSVFHEATLARYLTKASRELPAAAAEYGRHNPQNWTPHLAKSLVVTGLVLDAIGFRQGEFYVRSGMDLLQRVTTTWQMPDGSDSEQNFNYYNNLYEECQAVPRMLKTIRPDLMTPLWEAEMRDAARLRALLMLRYFQLAPSTTMPPGNRYGIHAGESRNVPRFAELLTDDTESVAIAAALQGKDTNAPKPVQSNFYFPYGGYSFIRGGWDKLDQCAYMFSSPHPGNSDWRASKGNNLFVLTAFGREMLIGGEKAIYDEVPSPLKVDGKEPDFHRGIPSFNHRHMMQSAWTEPSPMRWLDLPQFTFTEAMYAGPYAEGDEVIDDVSHHRQALFVRTAGLWIITDRIHNSSGKSRHYDQVWRLPILPATADKDYKAFDRDRISINEETHVIRTDDANAANLSIYQFGPDRITYDRKVAEWNEHWTAFMKRIGAPRMSERLELASGFSGEGNQILVSVLYPRKDGVTDLSNVRGLSNADVVGFEGDLPTNGGVIRYVVSRDGPHKLTLSGITVTADMLAVFERGKKVSGVVLNGRDMTTASGPVKADMQDFAFDSDGEGGVDIDPIYRPLTTVDIGPAANVFVGSTDVSLASVEGAEIRYTTDGTDPSPASALYTAPLKLSETTMVKARAYRNGFAKRSKEDPTFVGPLTSAVFTRQDWHEPETVQNTTRGLDVSVHEGAWQDLYQSLGWLRPVKTGSTGNLFDSSLRTTQDAQAFRHTGYLNVPADGIYTFYAPHERTWQHVISGYDLRVAVAGIEWQPAARRHALGTWSIPLKKGIHAFRVDWIDHRSAAMLKLNNDQWKQYLVWPGAAPNLLVSGPGLEQPQPLPNTWFLRASR